MSPQVLNAITEARPGSGGVFRRCPLALRQVLSGIPKQARIQQIGSDRLKRDPNQTANSEVNIGRVLLQPSRRKEQITAGPGFCWRAQGPLFPTRGGFELNFKQHLNGKNAQFDW